MATAARNLLSHFSFLSFSLLASPQIRFLFVATARWFFLSDFRLDSESNDARKSLDPLLSSLYLRTRYEVRCSAFVVKTQFDTFSQIITFCMNNAFSLWSTHTKKEEVSTAGIKKTKVAQVFIRFCVLLHADLTVSFLESLFDSSHSVCNVRTQWHAGPTLLLELYTKKLQSLNPILCNRHGVSPSPLSRTTPPPPFLATQLNDWSQ